MRCSEKKFQERKKSMGRRGRKSDGRSRGKIEQYIIENKEGKWKRGEETKPERREDIE